MTEDLMTEEELDKLIRMVASKHHVSPEEVRKSMEISVHDAWVRAKDTQPPNCFGACAPTKATNLRYVSFSLF